MATRNQARPRRHTMAARADRHDLYQRSVQLPESDIEFCDETFRRLRKRTPLVLREDFCGTAYLSTEWCKTHPRRRAIGVDLCADTLAWGRAHNLQAAGAAVARRVQLIHGNVLTARAPEADIVCAFNYSYCVFKTRAELRRYFKAAHRGLKRDGLLVLDLFGGTESITELEEEREEDDFTYVWEHAKYNPITHEILCHIHFRFPDGSAIERAFTYDWRLWGIPEIRELLEGAGFRRSRVYWEEMEDDPDDPEMQQGSGEYREVTEVENQESWSVYIVAEK